MSAIAPAPGAPAPGASPRDRLSTLFDAATLLLAVMSVARLAQQATGARFFTDECFHAHVAGWIAAEHRLPRTIPGFYSGLAYSYPPLFHLLGAAGIGILGAAAFRYLNVALWASLLACLFSGLGAGLDRAARRWAVVLCVANHWLALHAVRLYAEMLFAALTLVAGLLVFRLARTRRAGDAAWLGAAAGLLALAKPAGAIAILLLAGAALVAAARRRGAAARLGWIAAGIAALVAAPYWIRNQVEFGSPLYPLWAPDLDRGLWTLTLQKYGVTAGRYFARVATSAGPWIAGLAAIATLEAARRRRPDLAFGGLALGVLAVALAPLLPIHDPRHVLPLLPLLALTSSVVVCRALADRPRVLRLAEAALIVIGIVHLARLPEYRRPLDLPGHLDEAYAAIRRTTAPDATILSLWTYDTFYYTGRPATWPIPWGQKVRPIDLFSERDPDRFLSELERCRIDAMLIPLAPPPERFDAANYPRSLVTCASALLDDGRLSLLWSSRSLALVARSRPPALGEREAAAAPAATASGRPPATD